MLIIIGFLLGTIRADSIESYEQLTVNYFFESICSQKYEDYKSIEFDAMTDTSVYVGFIHSCRQWDEREISKIGKGQIKGLIQLKTPATRISIKKISNSKRLKLKIGTMIQLGDSYAVPFIVYRPSDFVDHYFIKFDKDGRIIDTCEVNEII